MSSLVFVRVERARERFRQDVADQLRMAAGRAGLAATVTLDEARGVLEFDEASSVGALPRIVAIFHEGTDGGAAGTDGLTLCAETSEEQSTLLELAWQDDPGLDEETALECRLAELEARTDQRLPLGRRGLNAQADNRTGRYARGDVIGLLAGDLKRALAQGLPARTETHALVPIEPPRPVPASVPDRGSASEESGRQPLQASDDLRALGRASRAGKRAPVGVHVEEQRANVSEFLISSLMQAMQRELAEVESHFVGPGVAASARGRIGRLMEWAMVGTAYGVEAKTNEIAVSSFLGGGGASWLYALVGPVLIGGLAVLSKSKLGKGAAYGLLMSWALAMASITASNQGYLDRAQGYFPRQPEVATREQAVAAARLRKEAAEGELKRLRAPVKGASEMLADARKRWQAAEIERAAKREADLREKARAQAGKAVIEAGVALNTEELQLREVILSDPSRTFAWWILFAIFAVINLAGPLAIARVLERWRADHAEAEAKAKDGHKKKSAAVLLRRSRSAQKAHAMLLLPALLHALKRDGVAPEAIAGLDLGDISQKAAERFDRGVNAKGAARRLFGLRGPAEGPG
jgi:hypothetical protein